MGQLANAINKLEAQNSGSLPSQTMVNPKENVNAITLRNGNKLDVRENILANKQEEKEIKVEEKGSNQR